MAEKREGPKFYGICIACVHYSQEYYNVQGDSGYNMYCNQSAERRPILETRNAKTPEWCPELSDVQRNLLFPATDHDVLKETP